jgi:hypothetical protein
VKRRREITSLAERQAEMRARNRERENLMSIEQAAEYTGWSQDELRYRYGVRKIDNRWGFLKDDLKRWMKYRAEQVAELRSKRRLQTMTFDEASLYLELSPDTLRRYIQEQKIPTRKLRDSFTKPMLDGWLRPKTPNPKLTPLEEEHRLLMRRRYYFDKLAERQATLEAGTLEERQAAMRERMRAGRRQARPLLAHSDAR